MAFPLRPWLAKPAPEPGHHVQSKFEGNSVQEIYDTHILILDKLRTKESTVLADLCDALAAEARLGSVYNEIQSPRHRSEYAGPHQFKPRSICLGEYHGIIVSERGPREKCISDNSEGLDAIVASSSAGLKSRVKPREKFNIQFVPENSQIRCLAHVVNLVVQKILATFNEAEDPTNDDYYAHNKDVPLHYDPEQDPDQLELDNEVFSEPNTRDATDSGDEAANDSDSDGDADARGLDMEFDLDFLGEEAENLRNLTLRLMTIKICSSPPRRRQFRTIAQELYKDKRHRPGGRKSQLAYSMYIVSWAASTLMELDLKCPGTRSESEDEIGVWKKFHSGIKHKIRTGQAGPWASLVASSMTRNLEPRPPKLRDRGRRNVLIRGPSTRMMQRPQFKLHEASDYCRSLKGLVSFNSVEGLSEPSGPNCSASSLIAPADDGRNGKQERSMDVFGLLRNIWRRGILLVGVLDER
ncbi:hypothetical protein B0H14DRAFT_3143399 [Mycena olivaceomarginata]|nr:hypothetical protein B0H14DRAFT_3143399 [Mycena olivaceomarginata]